MEPEDVTGEDEPPTARREGVGPPASVARGPGWGAPLAATLGVLLLLAGLLVAALAFLPALSASRARLPVATGGSLLTLALAASVASLVLAGLALLALASAARRAERAVAALDAIERRLTGVLRREDVPEDVRSGRLLDEVRRRDARFMAIESSVADLPDLVERLDRVESALGGATVVVHDAATGEPRDVPVRFARAGGARAAQAREAREARERREAAHEPGGSPGSEDVAPVGALAEDASVEDLEGVGPEHARALRAAGYVRAGDLLADRPDTVAARTGVDARLVARWRESLTRRPGGVAGSPRRGR